METAVSEKKETILKIKNLTYSAIEKLKENKFYQQPIEGFSEKQLSDFESGIDIADYAKKKGIVL